MAIEDPVSDLIREFGPSVVDAPAFDAEPMLFAFDEEGWSDAEPRAFAAVEDQAADTAGADDFPDPVAYDDGGRDVVDQKPFPVRYSGLGDGADPTVLRGPSDASFEDSGGEDEIVHTLGASGPADRPIDLIDTRRFTPGEPVSVGASLSRSATYDGRLQFYEVLDSHCSVRDPFTGRRLLPADPGYREAALSPARLLNRAGQSLQVNDGSERSLEFTVPAGQLLAPVLILPNGDTWFSPPAANRDGFAHFRSIGGGAYGIEDGAFGGDRDFDDLVFRHTVAAPSA